MSKPKTLPLTDDLPVRKLIADKLDQNFLVEAAAGTGKTTCIVERMVALVATGACRMDQLAAVTFTRKAGAELRDRFQAALLRRLRAMPTAAEATPQLERERLQLACDGWSQAFVGTIHSFCTTLLRERPIEFGVDPAFQELSETDDRLLREQAWHDNINDLLATSDPLITQLNDLGIERGKLKDCFHQFIDFRDIDDWPCSPPVEMDLEAIQSETRGYIDHMRRLIPQFRPPEERGSDKLMERYESIVRAGGRGWNRECDFFKLLERFDASVATTQSGWHCKATARQERDRWNSFRAAYVTPAIDYWRRRRYRFLIDFLRRAVKVYERLKQPHGGLDYQDLLLKVSQGLRKQPELRSYFQQRFTHLLVDEFQDTDPIQAEMMLYLTSSNTKEVEWSQCRPRPGSLFLVGDPKQSIYRFRRGDIILYNQVKEIFRQTGEVLSLVKNFRSRTELLQWNNALYQSKFGSKASDYSPAAADMLVGRVDAVCPTSGEGRQQLCGLYRLELSTDDPIAEVIAQEADQVARLIRYWIDQGAEVPRTPREIEQGRSLAVEARDFLIIPWGKKNINRFTAALQHYSLPYEVAGGNPLKTTAALQTLIDCLQTIDDPYHPVHFLALLRNFFGLSDRDLYLFKQAGGQFNFVSPLPSDLSEPLLRRLTHATQRLKKYQLWMRGQPFVTSVERIAEDLGLLADAAASGEGNAQTGGLFKAIERLRFQNWDFDSAADMIEFLQSVLDAEETDGCTALAPDPNAVRIMNLHKAKGLEAPIVFLVDTTARSERPITSHIDRRHSHPRGYFGITEKYGQYHTRPVATPENWTHLQQEEKKFLTAEMERMLYVATTRAGCATIVSLAKPNSKWASLQPYLTDAPALTVPSDQEMVCSRTPREEANAQPAYRLGDAAAEADIADSLSRRWDAALKSSYSVVTAKKLGLKGKSRPKWEASGDFGHQWGSAVHELLELRHKLPEADLRPSGLRIAAEYQLGCQRGGELLALVDAVTASKIWQRAMEATRCYSELPIEVSYTDPDDGGQVLLRGVIDLIFKEEEGWVIVDYKTDDIGLDDIPSAIAYYRSQLEQYAQHWQRITGESVAELGLYFTRIDTYRKCR